MNIFVLDSDPAVAARMHCDRHVVKMILEYGQLLSTAHRVLDGAEQTWRPVNPDTGKTKLLKFWVLPGEQVQPRWIESHTDAEGDLVPGKFKLDVKHRRPQYNASHLKHPAAIWARANKSNYNWLFSLFEASLSEYTHRYGKTHAATRIHEALSSHPLNLPEGEQTQFPISMADEFKVQDDVIASYHNYYLGSKIRFAKWTNRDVPEWFSARLPEGRHVSDFARTRSVL